MSNVRDGGAQSPSSGPPPPGEAWVGPVTAVQPRDPPPLRYSVVLRLRQQSRQCRSCNGVWAKPTRCCEASAGATASCSGANLPTAPRLAEFAQTLHPVPARAHARCAHLAHAALRVARSGRLGGSPRLPAMMLGLYGRHSVRTRFNYATHPQ